MASGGFVIPPPSERIFPMKSTSQVIRNKKVTSAWAVLFGLALLAGCQNNPSETTVQKSPTPPKKIIKAPKKTEPKPKPKPTKTEEEPASPTKPEPKLPPVLPTTEELAVKELEKRGGKAEFNKNGNVDKVIWQFAEITDDDLIILQKFTFLDTLDLTGTPIGDAGLKHLRGLDWLRYLHLAGTGVGDAGMEELKSQGHSRLEWLCVEDTKVTDKGVKSLEAFDGMWMLHLAGLPGVTDACIDSLIKLPNLHEIKLERTKVTEDGKARLVKENPKIEFIGGPDGIPPDVNPNPN